MWDTVAAKHAAVSTDLDHAVIVAYVSDKDPWSPSMRNSTLACEPCCLSYTLSSPWQPPAPTACCITTKLFCGCWMIIDYS